MSKPAARIGDMHMCPMVTPGTPPIPHVGGPIVGPGMPTVLIGGMPAASMGDMCTCVGPPDTIILGSMGVMIGGKPAARMGDMCAHGGMITVGMPTVLIGEISPGGPNPVAVANAIMTSVIDRVQILEELGGVDTLQPPAALAKAVMFQTANMMSAAMTGMPFVHDSVTCAICSGR